MTAKYRTRYQIQIRNIRTGKWSNLPYSFDDEEGADHYLDQKPRNRRRRYRAIPVREEIPETIAVFSFPIR